MHAPWDQLPEIRCGLCGSAMVRCAKGEFGPFFGCARFPACTGQRKARKDGTPEPITTDEATRSGRKAAHAVVDPIWQHAETAYTREELRLVSVLVVRNRMRSRVYRWLAHHLDIPADRCHMALFDAATCARVVALCAGQTPATIRAWSHEHESEADRDEPHRSIVRLGAKLGDLPGRPLAVAPKR